MRAMGYAYMRFDTVNHEDENILTKKGFENIILMILKCAPGALVWIAIPCSSWIFLSRDSTGRRMAFGRVMMMMMMMMMMM
eukprot:1554572-Karenia_brevis.AAC.1